MDLLLLRIETLINPVILFLLLLSSASSETFTHFMTVWKQFSADLRVILLHVGLDFTDVTTHFVSAATISVSIGNQQAPSIHDAETTNEYSSRLR